MMQYYTSTGELKKDSVFYQLVHRCLSGASPFARSREWCADVNNYTELKSFLQTLQNNAGAGATMLLHGAPNTDDLAAPPGVSRAQRHFQAVNLGTHHPRSITRLNPAIYVEEGMQVDDILNFAHTVLREVPESCFSPFPGKVNVVAFAQRDGMAIKRGLQTCEATMTNCGVAGESMTYEEAATYTSCSDTEVRWLPISLCHVLPYRCMI
jgi:hypothetical protein